jgi:hypothetical protein
MLMATLLNFPVHGASLVQNSVTGEMKEFGYFESNDNKVKSAADKAAGYGFTLHEKWQKSLGETNHVSNQTSEDEKIPSGFTFSRLPESHNLEIPVKPGMNVMADRPAAPIKNKLTDPFGEYLFPMIPLESEFRGSLLLDGDYTLVDGQDSSMTSLDSGIHARALLDLHVPVQLRSNTLVTGDMTLMTLRNELYNDKKYRLERLTGKISTDNYTLELGNVSPAFSDMTLRSDLLGGEFNMNSRKFSLDTTYGSLIRPIEETQFMRRTLGITGKYDMDQFSIGLTHVQTYDSESSIDGQKGVQADRNTLFGVNTNWHASDESMEMRSEFVGSATEYNFNGNGTRNSDFAYRLEGLLRTARGVFRGTYLRSGPEFETFAGFAEKDVKEVFASMDYDLHSTFRISTDYTTRQNNIDGTLENTEKVDIPAVHVSVKPFNRNLTIDMDHSWLTRKNDDLSLFREETRTDMNFNFDFRGTRMATRFGILDEKDHADSTRYYSTHSYGVNLDRHFTKTFTAKIDFNLEQKRHIKIEQMDFNRLGRIDLIWDPSRSMRYTISYGRTDRRSVDEWYNSLKDNFMLRISSAMDSRSSLTMSFDTNHYQYKNQSIEYWEVLLKCSADIRF